MKGGAGWPLMSLQMHTLLQESPRGIAESGAPHLPLPLFTVTCNVRKSSSCFKNNAVLMLCVFLLKPIECPRLLLRGSTLANWKAPQMHLHPFPVIAAGFGTAGPCAPVLWRCSRQACPDLPLESHTEPLFQAQTAGA